MKNELTRASVIETVIANIDIVGFDDTEKAKEVLEKMLASIKKKSTKRVDENKIKEDNNIQSNILDVLGIKGGLKVSEIRLASDFLKDYSSSKITSNLTKLLNDEFITREKVKGQYVYSLVNSKEEETEIEEEETEIEEEETEEIEEEETEEIETE